MNRYRNMLIYLLNILWIAPLSFYIAFNAYNRVNIQIGAVYENSIGTYDTQMFFRMKGDPFYSEAHSIFKPIYLTQKHSSAANIYTIDPANPVYQIRFDPINSSGSKITITNIEIIIGEKHYPMDISLLCASKNTLPLNDIGKFQCHNNISFVTTGSDPSLQIISNYQKTFFTLRLKEILVSSFLLTMLLLLVLFSIIKIEKVRTVLFSIIGHLHIRHSRHIFSFSFLFLLISIILVKSFVILIDIFFYQKEYCFFDIVITYTEDILLATVFGLIALFILFLAYLIEQKLHQISTPFSFYIMKGLRLVFHIFTVALSSLFFIFGFYYLISGYIFSEWGAFVESKHIVALMYHGGEEEAISLLFRLKTFLFIVLVAVTLFAAYRLFVALKKQKPKKAILFSLLLLFLFASFSYFPLHHIYRSKPTFQSPVVLLARGLKQNSEGVPSDLIKHIALDNFNPLKQSEIPKKYRNFYAIAKNYNVIFYIMESTRKKSVPVYGYKRDTMPFLSKLAKHSLIFTNAYVNQPRSCKTLASLNLGIYPDPRTSAITWHYHKIRQPKESLFGILNDNNYSLYFGTLQENYGGDNFDKFMDAVSSHNITTEDINNFYDSNRSRLDEQQLTNRFLIWSAKQERKFAAILWTKSAHMPYSSPYKKFEEKTKLDMYDNSLVNIDHSLRNLVQGLKSQGKLKSTIIVIFGDHGEAVGQKMDWGHGNFLYDYSIRIPFLIYNALLFEQTELDQRFQIKDIANTIFYLLGIDRSLNQSINIFKKSYNDKIYLSNVYQDFKLGIIFDTYKFVYRPEYDMVYLYDLKRDPEEIHNIVSTITQEKTGKLKEELLRWYKYQLHYLDHHIMIGKRSSNYGKF